MRVALIQAQLRQAAAADNLVHLAALMDQSTEQSGEADLYVLPETFATGFLGDGDRQPEDMTGPSIQWMQQQARQRQAALCGSLVIGEAGQRFNRFIYVDASGDVLAHYDKRHLFGFGGEDQRYQAGQERVTFSAAGWRVCPQICYDLRFPVWCRHRNDYDLLVFVANWPIKRVFAWQHLLRARAIENQCYVIGVNRAGPDGVGTLYGGHSAIYGPLGEIIVELGQEPALAMGGISLSEVQQVRMQLPFQQDADAFQLC